MQLFAQPPWRSPLPGPHSLHPPCTDCEVTENRPFFHVMGPGYPGF